MRSLGKGAFEPSKICCFMFWQRMRAGAFLWGFGRHVCVPNRRFLDGGASGPICSSTALALATSEGSCVKQRDAAGRVSVAAREI